MEINKPILEPTSSNKLVEGICKSVLPYIITIGKTNYELHPKSVTSKRIGFCYITDSKKWTRLYNPPINNDFYLLMRPGILVKGIIMNNMFILINIELSKFENTKNPTKNPIILPSPEIDIQKIIDEIEDDLHNEIPDITEMEDELSE